MLPFPPDPLYTAEELAAYNAINEVLAIVDIALGTSGGDSYFLGLAPVEPIIEDVPTDLELDAIAKINELLKRVDDVKLYQPETDPYPESSMFALFDAHDPLDFVM